MLNIYNPMINNALNILDKKRDNVNYETIHIKNNELIITNGLCMFKARVSGAENGTYQVIKKTKKQSVLNVLSNDTEFFDKSNECLTNLTSSDWFDVIGLELLNPDEILGLIYQRASSKEYYISGYDVMQYVQKGFYHRAQIHDNSVLFKSGDSCFLSMMCDYTDSL